MEIKFKKIFGWLLLVIGLALIAWTLVSSHSIFIGKKDAPAYFSLEEKPAEKRTLSLSPAEELEEAISQQIKEALPLNELQNILNLAVWSLLAFILIFGAGQISGLGIKLLKNGRSS